MHGRTLLVRYQRGMTAPRPCFLTERSGLSGMARASPAAATDSNPAVPITRPPGAAATHRLAPARRQKHKLRTAAEPLLVRTKTGCLVPSRSTGARSRASERPAGLLRRCDADRDRGRDERKVAVAIAVPFDEPVTNAIVGRRHLEPLLLIGALSY